VGGRRLIQEERLAGLREAAKAAGYLAA